MILDHVIRIFSGMPAVGPNELLFRLRMARSTERGSQWCNPKSAQIAAGIFGRGTIVPGPRLLRRNG